MTKHYSYTPQGVCSSKIHISTDNDIIVDVEFIGGCNGNAKGISSLITGMKIKEVIKRLNGISCSGRPTSCPDQLSKALTQILNSQ